MLRHGIEWEQLGTHDEHLSVINYKKEQRAKEVKELDKEVETLKNNIKEKKTGLDVLVNKTEKVQNEIDKKASALDKTQNRLDEIISKGKFIATNAAEYDNNPLYELPEPKPFMTSKSYYDNLALPLVQKLKNVIRSILSQYFDLKKSHDRVNSRNNDLSRNIDRLVNENKQLREVERDYYRIESVLGKGKVGEIIKVEKTLELEIADRKRERSRERMRSHVLSR
jgi:predicted  nucleic acid-binding Zn-ribbon protein